MSVVGKRAAHTGSIHCDFKKQQQKQEYAYKRKEKNQNKQMRHTCKNLFVILISASRGQRSGEGGALTSRRSV